MRTAHPTRQQSCTVAVERNQYGAMTLRTETGRTYQVVEAETPTVADQLAELSVDSRVTVTLARSPGRGSGWRVLDVGSGFEADTPTPAGGR